VNDILDQLSVNPKQEITLSHQLKQQIAWLIASGKLKTGDTLPALRHLAQRLSINLHTVRSAYQMLELDGLVETRQGRGAKVLAFDPRLLAQSAGSIRTHTVGVIVPSLFNPFYHALLQGAGEEADQVQTLLFVCNSHDDPSEAWRYFLQLSARQVDGIIIASHKMDNFSTKDNNAVLNKSVTLPLVSVDAPGFAGPSVVLDLEGAGYQAAQHLIQHGHRRIGLITYFADIDNILPVNSGFLRALQEAGIPEDPARVVRVKGFDIASGSEGALMLTNLSHPPTAIFAITDLIAAGALQALRGRGYRVPQDIALVGFNDIPLAALLDPPLTTVAAPAYQMGRTAMRMLQSLIEGKRPPQTRVMLPTSLVLRQSCGEHRLN
jgi:DNA-binding LacI/PurR family transcriptional regulator